MNIVKMAKIPSEYYDLEMTEDYCFKVVKKCCDVNDPVSVLRYKLAKKFGVTSSIRKANKLCNKINSMKNERYDYSAIHPYHGQHAHD